MHVPFTSDEALVEEAREGARLAFETLIQPLISPAYRLALVMVRDPSQAEDCVQEAALRAWRARAQLRGGAEGLRAWVLAIVPHECRNWLRGRWIRLLRPHPPPLPAQSGRPRGPAGPVRGRAAGPARAAARRACRTAAPLRARRGGRGGGRRSRGAPGRRPFPNPPGAPPAAPAPRGQGGR